MERIRLEVFGIYAKYSLCDGLYLQNQYNGDLISRFRGALILKGGTNCAELKSGHITTGTAKNIIITFVSHLRWQEKEYLEFQFGTNGVFRLLALPREEDSMISMMKFIEKM